MSSRISVSRNVDWSVGLVNRLIAERGHPKHGNSFVSVSLWGGGPLYNMTTSGILMGPYVVLKSIPWQSPVLGFSYKTPTDSLDKELAPGCQLTAEGFQFFSGVGLRGHFCWDIVWSVQFGFHEVLFLLQESRMGQLFLMFHSPDFGFKFSFVILVDGIP